MDSTFDQYIQNPMGKANAVISNREMYRGMYSLRLDTIMVREMGKVDYHLYKDGDDKYIAYIKVPSEVVEKFYYDVIIEFTPTKDTKKSSKSLKDYKVRFYSNDPAFVFTFAHAFIKNDMFIKDFEDKMSKKAVKQVAKTKNPLDTVGYVKSLYFAYLIMERFNLFAKVLYRDKYNKKSVKNNVMHADQKIALRQEAAQEISSKGRKAKVAEARARREKQLDDMPNKTSTSSRVKTVDTTSMISKPKGIKRTNVIKRQKKK